MYKLFNCTQVLDFPGGTSGKESAASAGDIRNLGSIPGLPLEKEMAESRT